MGHLEDKDPGEVFLGMLIALILTIVIVWLIVKST